MQVSLLVFVALLAGVSITLAYNPERRNISEQFYQEIVQYEESHEITPKLQELIQRLSSPYKLNMERALPAMTCDLCDSAAFVLLNYYNSGKTYEQIYQLILDLCLLLNIQTEEVCSGLLDLNLSTFLYIFDNAPNISAERICAIIFQGEGCRDDTDPIEDWTVNVDLGDKPAVVPTEPTGNEVLTVIHLSDVHFDPTYLVGGNAACQEPTCCRRSEGSPSTPGDAAGYWGDYRDCDTPLQTLQNTLDTIVQQYPKIDFVYFSGDLVDHGVWETSREYNLDIIETVLTAFKKAFGDVPVFPALGNHEPSPLNVFAPPEITDDELSTKWLYEAVSKYWSTWLTNETLSTVLQGGYYTTLIRPGLRVIVLNNNVCYTYNWWLLYDTRDPGNQLQWLAEMLLQAEESGEKVHILTHIPPGDSECFFIWSREFRKIIDRFENTVVAHFNGHTHKDEFHVFYALDDLSRANNVAFDGGSVTAYSNLNSNFRVYQVDADTGVVMDLETWIFNLTAANENSDQNPKWFKLYSFKEDYGVDSMLPEALDELVHRMAAQHELLQQYNSYFVKLGDPLMAGGCDSACEQARLCDIVKTDAEDRTKCEQLLEEYNANIARR